MVINWGTPNTMDALGRRSYEAMMRQAKGARKNRQRPGNLREQVDPLMCLAYKQAILEAHNLFDKDCVKEYEMKRSLFEKKNYFLSPGWVELFMGLDDEQTILTGAWQ